MGEQSMFYHRVALLAVCASAFTVIGLLISVPLLYLKVNSERVFIATKSDKFKIAANALWEEMMTLELTSGARKTRQSPYGGQSRDNQGQSSGSSYNQNTFLPFLQQQPFTHCSGCAALTCPVGPPGPPGPAGGDGIPGRTGKPGHPGVDGLDVQLEPEPDLPCVICPGGPPGPRGPQGERGRPGPLGTEGAPGIPAQGGHEGEAGITGPVGIPGPRGLPGQKGSAGEDAVGGIGVKGPKGPPGPRGVKGPPGMAGRPSNVQGRAGTPGSNGQHGPAGNPGRPGPPGPWGPPGDAGMPATYCPTDCGVQRIVAPSVIEDQFDRPQEFQGAGPNYGASRRGFGGP